MAGVNYEVNIQLNAKTLDKQLGDLEKRVNNLKKNLAAPLRNEDAAARRSLTTRKQSARLAERQQATQIVTYNLGRKTNELEARGVNVAKIREKLSAAAKENDKGRLTMARAQNSVARTLIAQETAKLRISTKANRMQAESIDALFKAQVKRYTLDQQIRRLEEAGVKTDKLRAKLGEITAAQAKRNFGTHKQLSAQLTLDIRKERDKLALQQRQTRELQKQLKLSAANAPFSPIQGSASLPGSPIARQLARRGDPRAYTTPVGPFPAFSGVAPSSPIGGAPNIPGSPAGLRRQRRIQQASGVALGAGFPLLFGGGPGSILGGAAGGLIPGPAGFAAQIGLSAIGQQFDRIGAAAINLGKALDPLTFDLKTVAGATGIAGTKTEEFLAKIEEFGGKAAAAAEASKLMASRVGKDATDALTKFGKDAQTVGNQISIIFTKVLAAIAAAAGPLLSSLGAGLTRINRLGGFSERTGLTGADLTAQKFLRKTGRLSKKQLSTFATGLGLDPGATAGQIRKAAEARAISSQQTFETGQTTALEVKAGQLEASAEAEKAAERAAKKAARELEQFIERRQRFEQSQADAIRSRLEAQFKETQELENQETLLRAKLAGNEEEVRYAIELGQLQEKYGVDEGRRLADKKAAIRDINEALTEQQFIQNTINNLVNTTGQQFAGLFENLINGTNNWNDSLRNVFKTLSSTLFRTGLQLLGGGDGRGFFSILSGNFTGKALGGQVSAGTPYLVGEKGPEMFVPGANGNIVPNNAMSGVQVGSININVENSGEQLSPAAQKQIANQVQGIVMATLVNERRSGGVLR